MRNFKYDKMKSQSQIRQELGQTCSVPGCNKPLTTLQGPGSKKLCRDHQLSQNHYPGGYGNLKHPHTMHKSNVCDCCGQDIDEDPRIARAAAHFGGLTAEEIHRVKRMYMHGDHNLAKSEGGNDTEENINNLCSFCHWWKTVKNNDGRNHLGE